MHKTFVAKFEATDPLEDVVIHEMVIKNCL